MTATREPLPATCEPLPASCESMTEEQRLEDCNVPVIGWLEAVGEWLERVTPWLEPVAGGLEGVTRAHQPGARAFVRALC